MLPRLSLIHILFSNYAALLTKDVLFADAFLVLLVQTVKLVACGLPRRDANAERAGEKAPVLFARHDWLLLALGAMGSTFLRNGGLVFPLAACCLLYTSGPRPRRKH